jgi:hypothetical protein
MAHGHSQRSATSLRAPHCRSRVVIPPRIPRVSLSSPVGPARGPRVRTDGWGLSVAIGAWERPRDARGAGGCGPGCRRARGLYELLLFLYSDQVPRAACARSGCGCTCATYHCDALRGFGRLAVSVSRGVDADGRPGQQVSLVRASLIASLRDDRRTQCEFHLQRAQGPPWLALAL